MRIVSAIQPSGPLHLGNYLGAVRAWVELSAEHEALYGIADLHALSRRGAAPPAPAELGRLRLETAACLLAAGLDPTRVTLFVQSQVPGHTELMWVLACLARTGELERMTQYKDARSGGWDGAPTLGLLGYPVLQAADVLLYGAEGVPVGEDQRQHLELLRTLAGRFNHVYGEIFVLPCALIPAEGARIMSLVDPHRKMSKTGGAEAGTLLLVDSPDVIARKVRRAVTDSGTEVTRGPDKPALTNLIAIYALMAGLPAAEVEARYAGRGYAAFKADLAELLVEKLRPLREAYARWLADPPLLEAMLAEGSDRAARLAARTLELVHARTGLGRTPWARAAAGLPAAGDPGLFSRAGEPSSPSR